MRILKMLGEGLYLIEFAEGMGALQTHFTEFTTTGMAELWVRSAGTIDLIDNRTGVTSTRPQVEEVPAPDERELAVRRALTARVGGQTSIATALALALPQRSEGAEELVLAAGFGSDAGARALAVKVLSRAESRRTDRAGPLVSAVSDGLDIGDLRRLLEIPEVREIAKRDDREVLVRASELGASDPWLAELRSLLAPIGITPDGTDDAGRTLLHHAATNEDQVTRIGHLVRSGASLDAMDPRGLTPLHLAAAAGRWRAVDTLVERGAKVDAADAVGATPLMLAAAAGHDSVVRELLEARASVAATDGAGRTALHHAALGGSLACIEELVRAGASPKAKDAQGLLPSSLATAPIGALVRWRDPLPAEFAGKAKVLCPDLSMWAVEKQGNSVFVVRHGALGVDAVATCSVEAEFEGLIGIGPSMEALVCVVGLGNRREVTLIDRSGAVRWRAPFKDRYPRAAFGEDGAVLIWTDEEAQMRDAAGALRWERKLDGKDSWGYGDLSSAVVMEGGRAIVALRARLRCLDELGNTLWEKDSVAEGWANNPTARFGMLSRGVDGFVLAWFNDGFHEDSLVRIDSNGVPAWRKRLDRPLSPAIGLPMGRVVACGRDGAVCIDSQGKQLWFLKGQFDTGVSSSKCGTFLREYGGGESLVHVDHESGMTTSLEGWGALLNGTSRHRLSYGDDGMLRAIDDDELVVVDANALRRLAAKPR
ncbi:MAG: ankyrin repeat domain-containing protein [Deltaproteobacteria bacterium]|nr:ankyrin repeat domain-containing protein [Deltaproteobacteria bacterium]